MRAEERDGKRVFALTDAGRTERGRACRALRGHAVGRRTPKVATDANRALRKAAVQLVAAAKQIGADRRPVADRAGHGAIRAAGKELYKILSED